MGEWRERESPAGAPLCPCLTARRLAQPWPLHPLLEADQSLQWSVTRSFLVETSWLHPTGNPRGVPPMLASCGRPEHTGRWTQACVQSPFQQVSGWVHWPSPSPTSLLLNTIMLSSSACLGLEYLRRFQKEPEQWVPLRRGPGDLVAWCWGRDTPFPEVQNVLLCAYPAFSKLKGKM